MPIGMTVTVDIRSVPLPSKLILAPIIIDWDHDGGIWAEALLRVCWRHRSCLSRHRVEDFMLQRLRYYARTQTMLLEGLSTAHGRKLPQCAPPSQAHAKRWSNIDLVDIIL